MKTGEYPEGYTLRESWRLFRIIGEFVEGFDVLPGVVPAVTVFGSARCHPDSELYRRAYEIGRKLGEAGFSVITGGGPGVMEAANKGALEAGAHSVGLNVEIPVQEKPNGYTTLAITFRYFFVRKVMLVKYATAFVLLPGGYGTLDEMFETLTLIQTGRIDKFPVILFGSEYWGGLVDWMREHVRATGYCGPEDLDIFHLTDDPDEVVRLVREWHQAHGTPVDNLRGA